MHSYKLLPLVVIFTAVAISTAFADDVYVNAGFTADPQKTANLPSGVDSSGAFTYSFPIHIPAGTAGMAPSLSINYNSNTRNGLLGVGFSLGGLSSIERDPDYGISFDKLATDYYLLDGQKLFNKKGTDYYHLERESYDQIEKIAATSTAKAYWKIVKKDGVILYYGNTDDSYIDAVMDSECTFTPDGAARCWLLTRVRDSHGNYYQISYYKDSSTGAYYPQKIIYTENISDNVPLKFKAIWFNYETRTDHGKKYYPSLLDEDHRLAWISVFVGTDETGLNGLLVSKYKFTYTTGSMMSQLASITQYGSDGNYPVTGANPWTYTWSDSASTASGSTLPATKFTWTGVSGSMVFSSPVSTTAEIWTYSPLSQTIDDYNGDGLDDLINNGGESYATGASGLKTVVQNSFNGYSVNCTDVDGDGKMNLYQIHREYYPDVHTGTSDFGIDWVLGSDSSLDVSVVSSNANGKRVSLEDYNGDGKLEFLPWNGTTAYINTTAISDPANDFASMGDVNGDGYTDYFSREWFKLSLSDGTYRLVQRDMTWGNSVDLNNDGLLDVFTGETYDSVSQMYFGRIILSKGINYQFLNSGYGLAGTECKLVLYSPAYSDSVSEQFIPTTLYKYDAGGGIDRVPSHDVYNQIFKDVDGDGNLDLIQYTTNMQGTVYFGDGFGNFITTGAVTFTGMIGDFNGDGRCDVLTTDGTITYGQIDADHTLVSNQMPNLLSQITLPTGGTTSIEYTAAPAVANAVLPSKTSLPKVANASKRPLVTKITTYDKISISNNMVTTYEYYNGLIKTGSQIDRYNLGFEKITATSGKTKTVTTYNQTVPLQGLVAEQQVYDSSTSALMVDTTYAYESVLVDSSMPRVYFFGLTEKYEMHNGLTTRVHTEYGDAGNVSLVRNYGYIDTSTKESSPLSQKTETQYEYSHIQFTGNWVYTDKYVLTGTTVYGYDRNGVWGKASEIQNGYDEDCTSSDEVYGNLLSSTAMLNDTETATVSYAYDAWGNVTGITDAKGNTTFSEYEPTYNELPIKVTNALGQITTITYTDRLQPETATDPNGTTVKSYYDVFGRGSKTSHVIGGVEQVDAEMVYCLDSFPTFSVSINHEDSENAFIGLTYVDGLGRVIQTLSGTAGNSAKVQDYYYDSNGVAYKVSVPYFNDIFGELLIIPYSKIPYIGYDATQKYASREYDALGRTTKVIHPDGTYAQTEYSGKITRSIDENYHCIEIEAIVGKIIKRTYKGAVEATADKGMYDALVGYSTTMVQSYRGSTVTTDNAGNQTVSLMDMAGRRISYIDPDTGTWTYSYDLNGNMVSQKSPKGDAVVFAYDALNRIKAKTYPDATASTFTYDESNHGSSIGRLTSTLFPIGGDSYTYDERGRVISTTRTLDGKTRSESATYDYIGRVHSHTMPDGEVLSYAYSTLDGNLYTLTGNSDYICGISYNEMGNVTQMNYGNGVNTQYDYCNTDSLGYSYRVHDIKVKNGALMNVQYAYDNVGNITSRVDSGLAASTETFTYDEMNRLVSSTSNVYGSKTYTYDKIDNILTKEGVSYTYNSDHPHQVAGYGTQALSYDANGNMLKRYEHQYSWDYDNCLKAVAILDNDEYVPAETNEYDTNRQRVKHVDFDKITYYWFGDYEEDWSSSSLAESRKYIIANGQKIAQEKGNSTTQYFAVDILGSTTVMMDAAGSSVMNTAYLPYGGVARNTGTQETKYMFAGQEMDANDLYYCNARYYDPELGRFIQPDPAIWDGNTDAPLSLEEWTNPYLYCMNNPVCYTDPTGLTWWVQTGTGGGYATDGTSSTGGTTTTTTTTTTTATTTSSTNSSSGSNSSDEQSSGDGRGSNHNDEKKKSSKNQQSQSAEQIAWYAWVCAMGSFRGGNYNIYLCSGGVTIGGANSSWLPAYGPCRFLAAVRIIQTQTGITFTPKQLEQIIMMCVAKNVFDSRYTSDVQDFWNIQAGGLSNILKIAGMVAGYDVSDIQQERIKPTAKPSFKPIASLIMIHCKGKKEDYDHWEEGDSGGGFVSDPYWGNSQPRNMMYTEAVEYLNFTLRRRK